MQSADLAEMLKPDTMEVDVTMQNYRKLVLGSDAYVNHPSIMIEGAANYERLLLRIGVPKEIMADVMGRTAASWMNIKPARNYTFTGLVSSRNIRSTGRTG